MMVYFCGSYWMQQDRFPKVHLVDLVSFGSNRLVRRTFIKERGSLEKIRLRRKKRSGEGINGGIYGSERIQRSQGEEEGG